MSKRLKKCPHCGKKLEQKPDDGGVYAVLFLLGLFIAYGIAKAQGWL